MNYLLAMAPSPEGGGGGGLVSTLIMFGLIFLIFYFMIIRPQQKRAKEREQMIQNVKRGDKIITSGGMHGTVAGIDEKTALVDFGNNIKIKMEKSAITSVVQTKNN